MRNIHHTIRLSQLDCACARSRAREAKNKNQKPKQKTEKTGQVAIEARTSSLPDKIWPQC
jgi:hypothetical protein